MVSSRPPWTLHCRCAPRLGKSRLFSIPSFNSRFSPSVRAAATELSRLSFTELTFNPSSNCPFPIIAKIAEQMRRLRALRFYTRFGILFHIRPSSGSLGLNHNENGRRGIFDTFLLIDGRDVRSERESEERGPRLRLVFVSAAFVQLSSASGTWNRMQDICYNTH